jgi:hypothetical protein
VWSEAPAAGAGNDATQQQQQRSLVLTGLPMAAIKTVLQQVLVTMAHSSTSSSSSSSSSSSDSVAASAVQQPLQLVGTSMVRMRAQLRSAGLSTDGARGELLERLQTATAATASAAAGDTATHSEDASSSSITDETDASTVYGRAHVINERVHSAQHDLVIEGVQGVGALVRAYLTKQLQPPLVFPENTGFTFDIDGDAIDGSTSSNTTAAAAREGTLMLTSAQLQQWQQAYLSSQLSAVASDGTKAKKRALSETPRYS